MNGFSDVRTILWAASLAGACVLFGRYLDHRPTLTHQMLIIAFHGTSLGASLLLIATVGPKQRTLFARVALALALLLAWRISYFPLLIIAGYVAAVGEGLLLHVPIHSVYPLYLFSHFCLHGMVAYLTVQIFMRLRQRPPLLLLGCMPLAFIAISISFIHPHDWQDLPSDAYSVTLEAATATLPTSNPYWRVQHEHNAPWQHKLLFFAAAITYDWLPQNAAWSRYVQGTLETEFTHTALAQRSTHLFILSHYRAFIAAQPFLAPTRVF